jgi:hypothetical protein
MSKSKVVSLQQLLKAGLVKVGQKYQYKVVSSQPEYDGVITENGKIKNESKGWFEHAPSQYCELIALERGNKNPSISGMYAGLVDGKSLNEIANVYRRQNCLKEANVRNICNVKGPIQNVETKKQSTRKRNADNPETNLEPVKKKSKELDLAEKSIDMLHVLDKRMIKQDIENKKFDARLASIESRLNIYQGQMIDRTITLERTNASLLSRPELKQIQDKDLIKKKDRYPQESKEHDQEKLRHNELFTDMTRTVLDEQKDEYERFHVVVLDGANAVTYNHINKMACENGVGNLLQVTVPNNSDSALLIPREQKDGGVVLNVEKCSLSVLLSSRAFLGLQHVVSVWIDGMTRFEQNCKDLELLLCNQHVLCRSLVVGMTWSRTRQSGAKDNVLLDVETILHLAKVN